MSSMRSDYAADLLADELPVEQPLRRRSSHPFTRFILTFGMGVAATLGWQSYGDTAREMISNTYPQLGWLAPQPAAAHAAVAPATPSPDPQELKAMSVGLAAVRQRVDQIAAQVAASQDQITRDITAQVQAVEQDILNKISAPPPRPDAAPVRRPVAPAPLPR